MTDSISFGKKGNAGKIDLSKVKDGLTKAQIAGNDKKLQSIFDKVDSNRNEVLEQSELQEFQRELKDLAGADNELTDKEAKGFKDADGNKMGRKHRKAFYEFLNKLSQNEQEPAPAEQTPPPADETAVNTTNPNEIPEETAETVVSQVADEIVPDSETDETSEASAPPVVEEEEEPEPQVTGGIIVQNGESPAVIAKKFGVPLQDLLDANESQLKGKGKNKYFLVGAEIVIPRKIEAEELASLTAGRKSAEETTGDYAQQEAVRAQRRAQTQAENEALGIQNRKGAGTKITGKYKGGKTEEFTVIGEAGRGRKVAKTKSGKIVTIAHDGTILQESYVQKTNFYDRKDTKKVTVNGKQYAVAGSRGDKHGRSIAIDEKGNQVVLSGDGKVLRNDYVSASDARDAGASRTTITGGENVTYVKDANGRVWYFDEKTGKALVKGQHAAMVKKEADAVSKDLLEGANYTWGTDEEKIERGIKNIYSPEIMAGVNKNLKASDSTYAGDAMTTPVEALLLDELSRSEVRGHIKTLAANGAYGTGTARDAAMGRNAAREIKYEVHGGVTGWTATKDLKEAMSLADTREARIAAETHFAQGEVKGSANEGSMIRQYIAEDGWNAQEVDQFDATWIKNGAYDHEHDQDHRNTVTGRLVFEFGNEESLHAGLEAMDPDSADYEYVSTRAAEENKKQGYQAHFNGQEALQTYIAGRATDENGAVETPEVSACNTLLYKGEKPVRIQAEEALYGAKRGDMSQMFNSMDPNVYEEMADMIADGEVPNCKDIKEAYDKALSSATNGTDKTTIKANAILSRQIEFSDAEIADFCIELMHSIDANQGSGASTGVSAKHTNTADYMTAQLEAILQANPNVIADVRAKVQNGTFESTSSTIHAGGSFGGGSVNITTQDNKDKYLAIINDSKHVADEAVFYDKDGNQITNPDEIAALTDLNMQALQGMRDYVAQLERDFKKGVDAEGGLSNMANDILTYSGLGTDRDDVATQYRNAKLMLAQLEAAAQGKLRDSDGNVISAQDLAQKITETQDKLAETNGDYQSSIQMTKMGIILAPVIAATTIASGGTAAVGWGTLGTAAAAGTAAGLTTYGLNAYEYNTSLTGNTAEAREQNAIDSAVAAVSTSIGFAQMKPIMGMANGLNTTLRTTTRLATTVASDVTVGAAGEYISTGNVSAQGTLMNAGFSVVPNVLGAKQFARKTNIPTPAPHVNPDAQSVHVSKGVKGDVNNHRDVIADGVVARNIDQQHLNANQRRMVEDGLADVPTPEELAASQKEIAHQPVQEADRPAFEAHQQQVRQEYAEAHELGNMVDPSSAEALQRARANMEADAPAAPVAPETPVPAVVKSADQQAIDNLTQSIAQLDNDIAKLERNMASAKDRGRQVTMQQKQKLERMQANRAAKQAELDALQRPAAEPEVVVKPDETPAEPVVKPDEPEAMARPEEVAEDAGIVKPDDAEPVVRADEPEPVIKPDNAEPAVKAEDVEPAVRADEAQPAVKPEETPTPENIARDAQAIPAAEIPAEHRSMRKSCQEKIGKIFSTGAELARGEIKTVLSDLKTLYNAVKNVKVRTQIARLSKQIQAYAKSKLTPVKPQARNQAARELPEINPNELVRVAGNGGKEIDAGYIQASKDARAHLNDAIISGDYTKNLKSYIKTMNDMHVISATGADGSLNWYNQVGEGGIPVNPGKIRDFDLNNGRYIEACDIEAIAQKYGDPYRVDAQAQRVNLDGIPREHQPLDMNTEYSGYRHYYPDGSSLEKYYYKEMHRTAKEALNLINSGATERQILDKLAEHYQYAANARPYGQINNSLFMNEINTLLTKAGMKTMPHGMLDHAAMRLQPETFKKYFADEYARTALDAPAAPQAKPQPETPAATPAAARGVSPAEIGEIGDAINRARNNYALDQAQARINRLPDSPQKRALQNQANLKSQELAQAEAPITPARRASEPDVIEAEPYRVDVSDQADVIAEPVRVDNDNSIDLILPNKNGEYNISVKEINNKIETASTEVELDAVQKRINEIEDCPEKLELQRKLDRKRQELAENNIVMFEDIEEGNLISGNKDNDVDNSALLYDDFNNEYNSFDEGLDIADDMGGFDLF